MEQQFEGRSGVRNLRAPFRCVERQWQRSCRITLNPRRLPRFYWQTHLETKQPSRAFGASPITLIFDNGIPACRKRTFSHRVTDCLTANTKTVSQDAPPDRFAYARNIAHAVRDNTQ